MGPPCPQLYLYSQSDVLIPPSDIERFQQQQAGRGVSVASHSWAHAPHCELLRYHGTEYKQQVASFASSLQSQLKMSLLQ